MGGSYDLHDLEDDSSSYKYMAVHSTFFPLTLSTSYSLVSTCYIFGPFVVEVF